MQQSNRDFYKKSSNRKGQKQSRKIISHSGNGGDDEAEYEYVEDDDIEMDEDEDDSDSGSEPDPPPHPRPRPNPTGALPTLGVVATGNGPTAPDDYG